MTKELSYEEWIASLPLHHFHNEYNEQWGSQDDPEGKMDALRAEEKRRGIDVQIGPEMEAGEEY